MYTLPRRNCWPNSQIFQRRDHQTNELFTVKEKRTIQAISTSPVAGTVIRVSAGVTTSASPMNASSSWSSSAAVLGLLDPFGARAMLALVLTLLPPPPPPPPREGRLRTGPPVKARLKKKLRQEQNERKKERTVQMER